MYVYAYPPVVGLPVGLLKAATIIAIKIPVVIEVNEINKSFDLFIIINIKLIYGLQLIITSSTLGLAV